MAAEPGEFVDVCFLEKISRNSAVRRLGYLGFDLFAGSFSRRMALGNVVTGPTRHGVRSGDL